MFDFVLTSMFLKYTLNIYLYIRHIKYINVYMCMKNISYTEFNTIQFKAPTGFLGTTPLQILGDALPQ